MTNGIDYSDARSFLILNCCCDCALIAVLDDDVDVVGVGVCVAVELFTSGELCCVFGWSSAKMVEISFCMKAHGTFEPNSGHFSPDGQYTSPEPELGDCVVVTPL